VTKVFGYPKEKSFSLRYESTGWQGHCVVGQPGVAELKRDQIRSAGPDFYAEKKVDFPWV